ncbi:MAG: toll/interleukin-1 receptor domain-containing protein, partial [bacterium]|nr:toll/interleukin-1 receptor domain-containing protein [bacterium]
MKKKIFISYSHKDEKWVKEWLLPRLENEGVEVYIDFRDFEVGKPALVNMEKAVKTCDHTLLVLTPNWVASEWTGFEALMLQTIDPAGLQGRILPLMLEPCEPPLRLAMLTYADFRVKENWETQFPRLLKNFEETVSPAPGSAPVTLTLSKLPPTSGPVLGREKELDILDRAWDHRDTTIVSLAAVGGVGKTALVNEWLNRMKKDNYRGARRVYAWSFYSQGTKEDRQTSAEDFIDDALRWFGDSGYEKNSAWDKGKRLAQLVRERKTLLILDGLEPLQYPPGEMGGCLKDQSLQALLKELAHLQPGLCIITTRVKVKDIESSVDSSVKRIELEKLTPVCGGQLLKALGVKGTELELRETAESFRGHALALRLLGRYLVVAHEGEIRKKDRVPGLTEEEEEGGHARRVMDSYERYLSGKPELNILYILGLFDRPAGMGAVDAVREEPLIDGLTVELKGISAYKWKSALAHLRQLDLLSTEEEGREDVLDCHPLVREHFGEKLRKNNPAAWQEAHGRLYNYYKNLPEKEYPDTLKELEPLYTAVTHGCLAGKHQEALDEVYWKRIKRGDEHYSTRKLGSFGSDLAALSGFFTPPWEKLVDKISEATKAFFLNQAALCLR